MIRSSHDAIVHSRSLRVVDLSRWQTRDRPDRRESEGRSVEDRSVGSPAVYRKLAEIAAAIGTSGFYEALSRLLMELVDSDRLIVVRYTRYGAPEFIINTAMARPAIEFYLEDLYRFDPLYAYCRAHRKGIVVTLNALRRKDNANRYYDEILRTAGIYDEIAVLLPAPGQIFIGVCCDESQRRFRKSEIQAIRSVYPLLDALHRAHLDHALRLTVAGGHAPFRETPRAMVLLDRNRQLVYCSDDWRKLQKNNPEFDFSAKAFGSPSGIAPVNADHLLHWQQLSDSFGVAPSGWMCVIERCSPEASKIDLDCLVDQFSKRHGLTPRETEITSLSILGYPNALIARKLCISHGTVKNHRYRLYQKLDITTERELFAMILQSLLEQDARPALIVG